MTDIAFAGTLVAAPIGIAVLSEELVFVFVNEELAAINGRSVEEHIGRTVGETLGAAADAWEGVARSALVGGHAVGPVQVIFPPARGGRAFEATCLAVDVRSGGRVVVAVVREITAVLDATQRFEMLAAVTAALASALTIEDIGRAVTTFVGLTFVDRVSFVTVVGDEVCTVDLSGYEPAVVEERRGRNTRLVANDPMSVCITTGEPVVVDGNRYPEGAKPEREVIDDATITAPIKVDGRVVAAIHVTREGPARMGPFALETTTTLAGLVGLAMKRLETTEQLEADRFRSALNAMIDEVTICSAIRDDNGEIVDFQFEFLKDDFTDRSGQTAHDLLGRRVLDLYPNWASSGVFDRVRRVVDGGGSLIDERLEYEDVAADGSPYRGTWRMQVVRLGDGFLSTSRDITAQLRADEELAEAKIRLITEHESVRLLQQLALPTTLPSIAGVTIATHYRAADVDVPVGGDWYDATTTDDGRLVVIVGDVAGHGRAAVSTMVRMRNVTNALAQIMTSPAAILSATSRILRNDDTEMATCAVVSYDPSRALLIAASAGHLPPIRRTGTTTTPWALKPGPPIGVASDRQFVDHELQLDGPSTLLLYTDGLVERRREPLDEAIDLLVQRVASSSEPYRPDRLCGELVDYVAGDRLEDDFCLLAIGIDPSQRPEGHATEP